MNGRGFNPTNGGKIHLGVTLGVIKQKEKALAFNYNRLIRYRGCSTATITFLLERNPAKLAASTS